MTESPCPTCGSIRAAESERRATSDANRRVNVRSENDAVMAFRSLEDRTSDRITAFSGSMKFVYIHSAWFALWIVINGGLLGAGLIFDGFPFGLLTLIVSLEAIFLSTFVMISQNRQAERTNIRAELDYETNVRSAIWSLHIGHSLGIDGDHIEQVVREVVLGSTDDDRHGT